MRLHSNKFEMIIKMTHTNKRKSPLICILEQFENKLGVNITQESLMVRLLEHYEKIKHKFLTLSYETRLPLLAIKQYIEVIKDGSLGEVSQATKNTLDVIDQYIDLLMWIVIDIIEMNDETYTGNNDD